MHTNRIINGHFNTNLKMIEHATFFYCHTPILFDQGVKRLIDLRGDAWCTCYEYFFITVNGGLTPIAGSACASQSSKKDTL